MSNITFYPNQTTSKNCQQLMKKMKKLVHSAKKKQINVHFSRRKHNNLNKKVRNTN